MSTQEQELIIKSHQKTLLTDLPLPCSKGRIRLAYLLYIYDEIAKGGVFAEHSMDDLLNGYIDITRFSEEELSRYAEIVEFVNECRENAAKTSSLDNTV